MCCCDLACERALGFSWTVNLTACWLGKKNRKGFAAHLTLVPACQSGHGAMPCFPHELIFTVCLVGNGDESIPMLSLNNHLQLGGGFCPPPPPTPTAAAPTTALSNTHGPPSTTLINTLPPAVGAVPNNYSAAPTMRAPPPRPASPQHLPQPSPRRGAQVSPSRRAHAASLRITTASPLRGAHTSPLRGALSSSLRGYHGPPSRAPQGSPHHGGTGGAGDPLRALVSRRASSAADSILQGARHAADAGLLADHAPASRASPRSKQPPPSARPEALDQSLAAALLPAPHPPR